MSLYIKRSKDEFQPFFANQYVPQTVCRRHKKRHHHDASAFLKSDILFSKSKVKHSHILDPDGRQLLAVFIYRPIEQLLF
ncbi:hypothetical protein MOD78_16360 [Bacillus haynesii]|uniref:hypothetical protein n=1 Tax=Bacillus haynesii TaxID=1925021 RepID=UPI00227EEA6B|nr:hypothetical protein [Bacillus haynesii]MCY8627196.1 hypothetical protein [Bacillus haynesii]